MKVCFKKKTKQNDELKNSKKKFPMARVGCKLIIFITFAYEILPVDGVCSW